MQRTLAKDTPEKIGEEVRLLGWVMTVRKHGKIAFFDLRDRTGILQIGGFEEDVVGEITKLNQQDAVEVLGKVKKREEKYINKENPLGVVELEVSKVKIVAKAETMPFDMGGKELNLELPTLLDFRSLSLKHPKIQKIFKVQAALASEFRKAAEELGCVEIFVPTIAAAATEGGAEVFSVDYYGNK